jgi:peptidoglycan hydrolase CwlO-like protein
VKFLIFLIFVSSLAHAELKSAYLTDEQQKYYKNDSFDGNNQRERIDSAVIEINKIHGEIASMKEQIQLLKKEVEELKLKK